MSDDRYIKEVMDYLSKHPEKMEMPHWEILKDMLIEAAENGVWANEEVKQRVIKSILDYKESNANG